MQFDSLKKKKLKFNTMKKLILLSCLSTMFCCKKHEIKPTTYTIHYAGYSAQTPYNVSYLNADGKEATEVVTTNRWEKSMDIDVIYDHSNYYCSVANIDTVGFDSIYSYINCEGKIDEKGIKPYNTKNFIMTHIYIDNRN